MQADDLDGIRPDRCRRKQHGCGDQQDLNHGTPPQDRAIELSGGDSALQHGSGRLTA
jgi:hypothetical protein